MINWIDRIEGTVEGTIVDRKRLMDMQGFSNCTTSFSDDMNTITETYEDGTLVTVIDGDTITETFTGTDGKVITKTTNISDFSISEVVA